MSAKDEIAKYTVPTRVGKGKPILIDPKIARPKTIAEARTLIEQTFKLNGWDESEQMIYFTEIGVKGMDAPGDVRKIIDDLDRAKMIIFHE